MPPLRGARAARANRGQTDVDIMEGLPVRQWRKQPVLMNGNPQKDAEPEIADRNTIWRELPMPKGSEAYPPWSQALLRAARAGRILQRTSKNDEDQDAEEEEAEGDLDRSFVANRWAQVTREAEEPEAEYLAKRRKGLPMLYGGQSFDGITLITRKCKVKRIDNEGNAYLLEVLIPEGTTIDGEVEETEGLPIQTPAAGTLVEGLGYANSEGVVVANEALMPIPPRRRGPPPKRKPKGPGRGRKKKVVIAEGGDGTATAVAAGTGLSAVNTGETLNADGTPAIVQLDGTGNADGEGAEGSEEDDEEGDEGDDREDGELSDADDVSQTASPMKAGATAKSEPKTDTTASALDTPIPQVHVTAAEPPQPSSTVPTAGVVATTGTADDALVEPQSAEEDVAMTDATSGPVAEGETAPQATIEPESASLGEPEQPVEVAETIASPDAEIIAAIPEEHNPLQGLTEPQSVDEAEAEKPGGAEESTTAEQEASKTEVQSADDDIFANLEAHLDGKAKED